MALIDDYQINLAQKWRKINATAGTFYTVRALYSLDMDLADESGVTALAGYMAYPTAFSAATAQDITVKDGTYLTEDSYLRLNGGSIQTSGYDTEIYRLTLNASGYTNAVTGDIFKVVTNGTQTARLLYYDNTNRVWMVRKISGTLSNNQSLTITSGTGAGTTASSGGVLTGEDGWANFYTLGTIAHHQGTYWEQNGVVVDPVAAGYYATAPSTFVDVLVQIRRAGTLINSGLVTVFNRVNRDLANSIDSSTTGDSYDYFQADLSQFGRSPTPLNTRPDLDDTLTNTQAANYLNGTTATIEFNTGTFNVDVDQDGSTESYGGQVVQSSQTNSVLWSVAKYFFRKGATTLIAGVQAQVFRSLNVSYPVTKDSPIGTIAGGTVYYARGWVPSGMASQDASKYQVITSSGTPKSPPTFYVRAVTGLASGYKVLLARRNPSDPNVALINEFTLGSGNNSGNNTLVLSGSIPADKPASGHIRVIDNSGNEDRYPYVSWTGTTLTLSGTLSKTYASGNSAYIPYIDETAAGSSISKSLRYVSDRDVILQVRLGSGLSKIEPFRSAYTITNADSSVPATAIADAINSN